MSVAHEDCSPCLGLMKFISNVHLALRLARNAKVRCLQNFTFLIFFFFNLSKLAKQGIQGMIYSSSKSQSSLTTVMKSPSVHFVKLGIWPLVLCFGCTACNHHLTLNAPIRA